MSDKKDKCFEKLAELGLKPSEWEIREHEAAATVDELHQVVEGWEGIACKNLFLRAKKTEKLFLVVMRSDEKLDLKKLQAQFKLASKDQLRFAPEELLIETLGVTQGAVSPLAMINDTEKKVQLLLDPHFKEALERKEAVLVHPLDNRFTVAVPLTDIYTMLTSLQIEPEYVQLD